MRTGAMPRGRSRARGAGAAGVVVGALLLVAALAAVVRAAALDPYVALRRSPSGTRLLAIAREALRGDEAAIRAKGAARREPAERASSDGLPAPPAALYVTLVNGPVTRACVGSDPPPSGDLAEAVRMLAAQARTGDRRRPPVRAEEIESLRIVIGFASSIIPISHVDQVDPGRDGLLVETDQGRVAFLPGEARTVAWAIREARRIGVLVGAEANAHLARFDVVTLSEPAPPLLARRKDADAEP